MLHQYPISITTDADGAATVYSSRKITGRVIALKYVPTSIATGAGLTITGETTAVAVLTKASAGTSTVWYYPMAACNKVADGSASTISESPVWLSSERLKVVVASGGATKAGTITLFVDE